MMDKIADIESEQFRAECHGRHLIVERAITGAFGGTLKLMKERFRGKDAHATIPDLDDFLCSDSFYNPGRGLPHSSGAGSGYDNISKYFFWLKDRLGLAQPACDVDLRTQAYSEFAAFLIGEYSRPHDPWFDRFKGGLYWPHSPSAPMPVLLMTEKLDLLSIGNPATANQFPQIGLIDLDTLDPPQPTTVLLT
jgi:hypothetical protein